MWWDHVQDNITYMYAIFLMPVYILYENIAREYENPKGFSSNYSEFCRVAVLLHH